MVTDALSSKSRGILASLALEDWNRAAIIENYDLQYYEYENIVLVYNVIATPSLLQHAKETQWQDAKLMEIWDKLQNSEQLDGWSTNHVGFVYYKGKLAITDSLDLREALISLPSILEVPRCTKT